jgi:hypothetical protein
MRHPTIVTRRAAPEKVSVGSLRQNGVEEHPLEGAYRVSTAITILKRVSEAGGFEAAERLVYNGEKYKSPWWRDAFVGTADAPVSEPDKDVESILNQHPSELSRPDIFAIGRATPPRDRRLLIASLMWGYGTTGLHYHRKMQTTVTNLLHGRDLDDRLDQCARFLAGHDVSGAYESMMDIPGIKSAYFTKYLYFKGRSGDERWHYPLILDSKVSRSLAALTGYRRLASLSEGDSSAGYAPRDDPESYCRYVDTMHRWAEHLDTTADVLEFYLWEPTEPRFSKICAEVHNEET